MLHFGKFQAESWATWDKVSVDFSAPGLTFLRGRSRDAGGNPNMAGKSTLVNGMYALAHGDHQLAVRKKSLKSITNGETKLRLTGHLDDKAIDIRLAGGKLSLALDGTDLEIHKQPTARQSVAAQIGISPELWGATVHVNGIEGNPLIRGTGGQRCQFLENAFDLNRWSDKYEKVADAISALKRAQTDLDEAKAELARATGPEETPASLKAEIADLNARAETLAEQARKVERQVASLETLPDPPPREAEHYRRTVEILSGKLSRVERDARKYQAFLSQQAEYKRYVAKRAKLKEEARQGSGTPVDKLTEKLRDVRDAIAAHDTYGRAVPRVKAWRDLAHEIAEAHGIEYADLNELRALSSAWIAALRPGAKNCPVCGSKFKGTVDRDALEKLRHAQDKLPTGIVKPKGDLKQLLKDRKRLEEEVSTNRLAERATRELDDLDKVTEPDDVPKATGDAGDLATKLTREKLLLEHAEAWERAGLSPKLKTQLEEKQAFLAKTTRRRQVVAEKTAELREKLTRAQVAAARRKDLQERIDRLDRELRLQPVYKALQGAYSPSGLRLMRLFEILESLISNLNEGSYTLRDRIVYGYKLSKNRDLTLTASTVRGTYDVRFLSGAESRFFCVNLLLTLLPLLPSNRRASLLILDEIEANMSSASRDILAAEYIPRLLEVVPSLWIVTPCQRQEFSVPGARELVAVKKDGTSRLVEGRVT